MLLVLEQPDVSLSKIKPNCETPSIHQTKKDQETSDDEDTPLFLRHTRPDADNAPCNNDSLTLTDNMKRSSAKRQIQPNVQVANRGRRTPRVCSVKGKKSDQTVVISSSEGHVSDESADSSPSSEWDGSDGGKCARRSRPSNRLKKGSGNIEDEESDKVDGIAASHREGARRHQPRKVKNSAEYTLERPGKDKNEIQRAACRLHLHSFVIHSIK
jgi:hypothetical protein